MESEEKSQYQVIVTLPAERWFYEIVEYLYEHYSLERAEEIANELRDFTKTLTIHPNRGSIEKRLGHHRNQYRFILYQRTSRTDVKIIYFIDESNKAVYVTDFFPTEMDDNKIARRSLG